MKYLILLSMVAISLCVNLSTQETLFNNALTEKLKGTSLGRAVLLLSQTKQQNFNPLFDALENLEKSLSISLTDENTKFQTFTQQTDNDLAYYEELVKKYNNEVSEYQIDIRDFLKTRTDYELELDVKRKELQEAKLQKSSIEQQQSQDERGFKKQTDDLNSAILILDEAIKLIEKARFSSFIESDAQELKILASRMKDQTLTKMLVELATGDYQNAETLRSTQRLLQNIRGEFQENVINLSSQADSSKNANAELIAQYDAKITQLSQEVIPQLQGDIQTKDGEINTKKDLLGESQANLAEAQERVKQLNHDLQSSTKTHQFIIENNN
ncbi:hypothetical protein pb186bvf_019001 [Paramecium bursaria]